MRRPGVGVAAVSGLRRRGCPLTAPDGRCAGAPGVGFTALLRRRGGGVFGTAGSRLGWQLGRKGRSAILLDRRGA
jgi:hypothetical protein